MPVQRIGRERCTCPGAQNSRAPREAAEQKRRAKVQEHILERLKTLEDLAPNKPGG